MATFTPFLNGVANQTFWMIPYFMIAIIALAFLIAIGGGLWWIFFWHPLTPYHGLLWSSTGFRIAWLWDFLPYPSYTGKTGMSFVFDENMNMDLITDRSSKVIFAETFKAAQEAENENTKTPAATLGTVLADFIFDPNKLTYPNSPQHKLMEDIAWDWNDEQPDDQVRTILKFWRYVKEGKFNEHQEFPKLKTTYAVPWSRVKMMYKDREEGSQFGWIEALAKKIADDMTANFNQFAIPILLFFAFIDLMYFVAWFVMRKPA